MTFQRNPQHRGKCPFYVIPQDPLSAETSVKKCVSCACGNNTQLLSLTEDLRQIAFLTIIEETPKYDKNHASGASYITFIKAKVCTKLWAERRKVLRDTPYPHQECSEHCNEDNPLVEGLIAEACAVEKMADTIIQQIEVEFLQKNLQKLLKNLTENERSVIQMKFFEEQKGTHISQKLDISEGRVTQLTQSALAKLGKAYINALETKQGNSYRNI